MKPSEIRAALQRAKDLGDDLQRVAMVYENQREALWEIQASPEAQELFLELVGRLQSLSQDLNELFPGKEIQLDEETIFIRTPIPRHIRQNSLQQGGRVVVKDLLLAHSLRDLVIKFGYIPPWGDDWPPIP
jgi:hypothetical protein